MDGIIEVLVKKEKTTADKAKVFGLYALAVIIAVFSYIFVRGFSIIITAAAFYVVYIFSANFDLEFEYCILDKDLIVDKIMSKRKRKQVAEMNGIDVVAITSAGNKEVLNRFAVQKTIFAAEKEDDENMVFIGKTKSGMTKLIIKSDERIMERYKMVMPSKIC